MSSLDDTDCTRDVEGKSHGIAREFHEINDGLMQNLACPTNLDIHDIHMPPADACTSLKEDRLLRGDTAVDLLVDEIDESLLNTPSIYATDLKFQTLIYLHQD